MTAPKYTRFHALYLAHRLTLRGDDARNVIRSLAGYRIDLRRHQVEAAVFALNSPLSGGVLLADEVGLGKTIEAGLVMAQFCAEQRRRILLIVPPSLQRQWQEELRQKFRLQSELLSSRQLKSGVSRSDDMINEPIIWIVSPGVAARSATFLEKIDWDLIIVDEAHWLRGLWYASPAQRPAALQRLLREHFTLLLSATPIQNSLLDLGALLSLLDQSRFPSAERFRLTYGDRESSPERVAALREAIAPMVSRRLRSEVRNQLKLTKRQVHTLDFTPSAAEKQLYIQISDYLNGPTLAFGTTSKLGLMTARK